MTSEYLTTGDIRLTYDAQIGYGDITVLDRDLERDDGLETAVFVSLFSDRRAEDGDALPDLDASKKGWWGDTLMDTPIGSKLWLIGRNKMVPTEVLPKAVQYSEEALQWMIDDGVAKRIEVEALRYSKDTIQIKIAIFRPNVERPEFFTYFYNWVAQLSRSA